MGTSCCPMQLPTPSCVHVGNVVVATIFFVFCPHHVCHFVACNTHTSNTMTFVFSETATALVYPPYDRWCGSRTALFACPIERGHRGHQGGTFYCFFSCIIFFRISSFYRTTFSCQHFPDNMIFFPDNFYFFRTIYYFFP